MSKKFVILDRFKSYLSEFVFAEKFDECILHIYVHEYPSETSMFTNKKTGEKFHARNSRFGWVEENDILLYLANPDKYEKLKKVSVKKATQQLKLDNQLNLFI